MEVNRDLLRWVLLIGAAPIWVPFLRTLWKDFNHALREEGGLLGSPPTPLELERMRRETTPHEDPLVHEPWVKAGEQRKPRLKTPGNRSSGSPPAAQPGNSPGRRRGFR